MDLFKTNIFIKTMKLKISYLNFLNKKNQGKNKINFKL